MPMYLGQYTLSVAALEQLTSQPEDRSEAVRDTLEQLGGKLHGFFYCLGDYDGVMLYELPDDTAAAAFAMATSSSGYVENARTTRLMNVEEAIEAMRVAGGINYAPPGNV